jgi:hypothetical protein
MWGVPITLRVFAQALHTDQDQHDPAPVDLRSVEPAPTLSIGLCRHHAGHLATVSVVMEHALAYAISISPFCTRKTSMDAT